MIPVEKIKLNKIKNSKGKPAIQATIFTKKGKAVASAPSGTSAGKYEAVYAPKPIDVLIKNAHKTVIPNLIGMDVLNQKSIDYALIDVDGTKNFSNIGGSVATAISMACLRSASIANRKQVYEQLNPKNIMIPKMMGKCIGGGAHAEASTEIQEFLSIPITDSIKTGVKLNKQVHSLVGKKLKAKKLDLEGGWIANISNERAIETLSEAVCEVSKKTGENIAIGIDVAASEFYKKGKYNSRTKKQQLKYMSELIQKYDIYYIEDAFNEEDFDSFKELKKMHKSALICGDDLFTTNAGRLKRGKASCNSIIIKPNQVGTITQTQETVELAKKYAYVPVISHRSGETKDSMIADLAVGWNIPFIKIGIVGRERTAKTSRLIQIEGENKK